MTIEPTATKYHDAAGIKTVWLVKWPSSMTKQGKAYYATTYPNSDLVFIETAAKRRPISNTQGRAILPQIRAAIERANA